MLNQDENKQAASSSVFIDIAAEEKGTAITRFSHWLKQFNDHDVKEFRSFLMHGKGILSVIKKEDYKMINLVVASAASQPRMAPLDTTILKLAGTVDELILLMNDVSNYEHKAKNLEASKVQREQMGKKMLAILQKYDVLYEQFNKQFVNMRIDKSKEQVQLLLARSHFIQAAQVEIAYQFSKFSDLITNYSADDLNLRELSYNEVHKIYISSHDSVLKYNQWLNNKEQVDEEILDNELAEKSIKSMIEATEKLDQALKDIVDYLKRVKDEPSPRAITDQMRRTELKLVQNYLRSHARFKQVSTMANLSFK
jgi:hypothetical protein